MTAIVAVETPGGVWLAWDSCITRGEGATAEQDRHSAKVFMSPGPIGIGAAGDAGPCQRLEFADHPEPPGVAESIERWGQRVIVPWRADAVGSEDADTGPCIIVAVRAVAILVDEDGFCCRSEYGYTALGSGAPFALGALAVTRGTGQQRAEAAVVAACRHSPWCSPPVHSIWIPTTGAPCDVTHH